MAFEVFTYSPSEIILDISGYRLTGFDNITVRRNSPAFQIVRGIRGKNSRVRNRDTSCTITIDLIQTSLANDVLSYIVSEDLRTNSARLTLDLTDTLGSSKIDSKECFIEGYADLQYSGNIQYRRWTLICLSTETYRIGGNARRAQSGFDSPSGVGSPVSETFLPNEF